ncbi:Spo0B domain-containing protein [Bacillus sp. 1P06AnD]|uniref:Spo0B domain-containing protein n=1 Tax=Bacillus sp. 1P06AnD TaxID=3132208 RepID=UPI00399F21B4
MDKKWGIIELVSCTRHDWLNKIQLIKGNIELGKMDNVKAIIDECIRESKNEAQLSHCNLQTVAEWLITSKWLAMPFILEYEVLTAVKGTEYIDRRMHQWLVEFVEVLSSELDILDENELRIMIGEIDQSLRFTFELQGKIKRIDIISDFLNGSMEAERLTVERCNEEELVFHMDWNGQ